MLRAVPPPDVSGTRTAFAAQDAFVPAVASSWGKVVFFDFPRFNQQVKPALPTLAQLPGTFCWQWLRSSYTDSLCRKPEAATFRSTGFAFAYARPPVRKLETVPGSVLHL